jgi:glycosyltransferase involved in cell wall biosynthesis
MPACPTHMGDHMTKPLTILGYPHDADGSGYYRFYLPFKHLARGTEHRILLPQPGQRFTPDMDQVEEIDMICGQRFIGPEGMALWEGWKSKTLLVYENDDDVLHPDNSSGLAFWHDENIRESYKKNVAISELVTVSTEPLADEMRQYNPNVVILPNHVDGDLLSQDRPRRDRLTIGWAGGMSHLIDWMQAAEPLRGVLDADPDLDMHFVGIDYSPLLHRECRFTPWKADTWSYYKSIDFDIGLAPLADTTFNTSKSHIKALEYMSLGIPVIASRRPAYQDMVVDGVTGYLVRGEDEWRQRLNELVNDEAMRAEMGAKGREVAANWTIQQGWKMWRDAYQGVAEWPR